jgi:hypothetical protein
MHGGRCAPRSCGARVTAANHAHAAARWTSITPTGTATSAESSPRSSKLYDAVHARTGSNSFGCLRSLVWVVLITIAIELAWWFLVMPLHQAGVF